VTPPAASPTAGRNGRTLMTSAPYEPPSSDLDQLAEAIRQRGAILFVGAGVSMTVGLPSWTELTTHMVDELDLPVDLLDKPEVTYQMLAEFYRLRVGSIGPLRSWMDRKWHVSCDAVRNSPLHRAIVALDFPIIYTTNYDRNLEAAFEAAGRPFQRIVNAKDMAAIGDGGTQIVKFHGDFDDDASLVLAETDYFDRISFDSPLDVKFRADALAKTILFIGYSMSDVNIRLLLHRLWQTWSRSGYERDRPRSFVFMPRGDLVQEAVLRRLGITLLQGQGDEPGEALTRFMEALVARVSGAPDEAT